MASEKEAQEAEYIEKEMKNRGEIEKMQQIVESAEKDIMRNREEYGLDERLKRVLNSFVCRAASLEQARALLQNHLNETVAEKGT